VSKIEILRQRVIRLYNEHLAAGMLPTSIRFLFYELVALSIISKQASGVLKPGAMACPCASVVVDDQAAAPGAASERHSLPSYAIPSPVRRISECATVPGSTASALSRSSW
jgi:hypothetical protein